jgi:hypothetical protein
MARGRGLTHNLEVRVNIGPKDWQRIKDAGLYDAVLFEYPDPTSTYSGEMRPYKVSDLTYHGAASFYNIQQATAAKEQLLKALYALKDDIETQKAGPIRETFEI